jgi:SAM-dependent methyltransferase
MTQPYQALSAIYDLAGWGYFAERMAGRMLRLAEAHNLREIEHVVDVACGTGIAVAAFAQAGYRVTGIDRSPHMLERARQRIDQVEATKRHTQPITLIEADMRDFTLPDGDQPADLVTCMYDSLNYLLKQDDLVAAFRCAAQALRAGGLYIFDVNTLFGLAEEWNSNDFIQYDSEDLFIAGRTRWDHERAINTLTFHGFIREIEGDIWKRFTEAHVQRGYPVDVLRALLQEAGLTPLDVYDAGRRSGPKAGEEERIVREDVQTGRVLIVARKEGTNAA